MGESFQDRFRMLNSAADYNSFSDLVSVYLKVFDHLTCIFYILEACSKF